MPTYEYRCPEGHEFERFQKMSEPPRAKCPVCGRAATRRISGGAGLIFKGSGFYITDYGKDGKGPRVEKEADAKSDAASKSETGADKSEAASGVKDTKPEKAEKTDSKASKKKKASS